MSDALAGLYEQAVEFTQSREWFTRARFQRVMQVGFVMRDRLLIALEDNGVVQRTNTRDMFRVVKGTR